MFKMFGMLLLAGEDVNLYRNQLCVARSDRDSLCGGGDVHQDHGTRTTRRVEDMDTEQSGEISDSPTWTAPWTILCTRVGPRVRKWGSNVRCITLIFLGLYTCDLESRKWSLKDILLVTICSGLY